LDQLGENVEQQTEAVSFREHENDKEYMNRLHHHIREALISGFRRDVDEICGLLGYYTTSCGIYRRFGTISVPSSPIILTPPH
jgi:hypothetical protein